MLSYKFKRNLIILLLIYICFTIFRYCDMYIPYTYRYIVSFVSILQFVFYIGLFTAWGVSIYRRILMRYTRTYLILFASLCAFWILVRDIKWNAFIHMQFETRILWYLFYVPIILLPIIGLYIFLSINQDDHYQPKNIQYVLLIPATLLILLVMTNEIHQFVFILEIIENRPDPYYTYNIGYYIICVFLLIIVFFAINDAFKKWRKINRTSISRFPVYVVLFALIYILIYALFQLYIGRFLDVTSFICLSCILFWESCIQSGLIRSNQNHRLFYKNSSIDTQILDYYGKPQIMAYDSTEITNIQFSMLKNSYKIKQENIVTTMQKIKNGYVVWKNDISRVIELNNELEKLHDELYGEVLFLEEEKKIKEERARIKKLNTIYNMISDEVLPHVEKIEKRVKLHNDSTPQNSIHLLKEIGLISCYIKRKTNILLQMNNNIVVTNDDMYSCYKESFHGLSQFYVDCNINYNPPDTSTAIHLLLFDIFEIVLEYFNFTISSIYINCFGDSKFIRYSIFVLATHIDVETLYECLQIKNIDMVKAKVTISDDDDHYAIVILIPCQGGNNND